VQAQCSHATRAACVLPLVEFLPKLIQRAMMAETDTVIAAFRKNKQVKKVFRALFM
jgi:hypothetical protein